MHFTSAALKARSSLPCFPAHSTAKSGGKWRLCRKWRRLLSWTVIPSQTTIPYSPDCWSSVNNVAWRWQISSSMNWVLYLRLSSTSSGVWEKQIKQCSSSVLGSRLIAHLHLTWCWSTPASCCTMLCGLLLGQQAILPRASVLDWAVTLQKPQNWRCLTAIMMMSQLRRTTRGWGEPGQDRRTSIWRPTHHPHAEKQSWRIPRTKVSSPASCVDIPRRITCSSLTKLDCLVTHEEADITLCSYMLKAATSSAETVRIVCDDTDVFLLLVYWTWRKTIRKNIQMEKWDGMVLDIHATVVKLGDKCGQLPGMHALSGCDTVSYPYGKGKKSALKVLMNNDIDGLQDVLGEPDIIRDSWRPLPAHSFSLSTVKRRPIPWIALGIRCTWAERSHCLRSFHRQTTTCNYMFSEPISKWCFGRQQIRGIHQSTLVTSAVSVGMSRKARLLHHLCPMHR